MAEEFTIKFDPGLMNQTVHETILDGVASSLFPEGLSQDNLKEYRSKSISALGKLLGDTYAERIFLNMLSPLRELAERAAKRSGSTSWQELKPEIPVESTLIVLTNAVRDLNKELYIQRSTSEEMELDSYASALKRKAPDTSPKQLWWEPVIDEGNSKANLQNFTAHVGELRKELFGMTISGDIMIPKNFEKVFSGLYDIISILAAQLKVNISRTGYVIATESLTWLPYLSGEKVDLVNLAKIDQDKKLSKAWLAINEAFGYLLKPVQVDQGNEGPDFARYVIASAIQQVYGHPTSRVEGTFLYTSKCQKAFEDTIKVLIPNWGDLASTIIAIFKNIVTHALSPATRESFMTSHRDVWLSLYKKDTAIYAACYNKVQKRRLTAQGKKQKAANKKLNDSHYESFIAIVKPSIDTARVPISTLELTVIKAVNADLQTLEEKVPLKKELDQARRKEDASHKIQLLHTKCKRIDNHIALRKQNAHKTLVTQEKEGKIQVPVDSDGNKKSFTPDQWRSVLNVIIAQDTDLLKMISAEFCCSPNGKVAWSQLFPTI